MMLIGYFVTATVLNQINPFRQMMLIGYFVTANELN